MRQLLLRRYLLVVSHYLFVRPCKVLSFIYTSAKLIDMSDCPWKNETWAKGKTNFSACLSQLVSGGDE
jgi:hypothetical protein